MTPIRHLGRPRRHHHSGPVSFCAVQDLPLRLPRRSFIIGSAAAGSLVLVGCGGGDGAADADVATDGLVDPDLPAFLVATFPDGFRQEATVVAGVPQRLAFVIRDQIDNMRDTAPSAVDLRISRDGEVVVESTVERRGEGIITPYYPLPITFDAPGLYLAELSNLPEVPGIEFLVAPVADVAIPQVGDALPATPTATTADTLGVTELCSRAVPCEFHELDLADVVANGRPTVLLIATPGYCQTDICGPVVDLLIDEAASRDDLDVIHAEVYVDPSEFANGGFPDLVDVVNDLALPFEPSLFVADGEGTIVARIDTTFDRSELRDALALV